MKANICRHLMIKVLLNSLTFTSRVVFRSYGEFFGLKKMKRKKKPELLLAKEGNRCKSQVTYLRGQTGISCDAG